MYLDAVGYFHSAHIHTYAAVNAPEHEQHQVRISLQLKVVTAKREHETFKYLSKEILLLI